MSLVRIFILLASTRQKVHSTVLFVYIFNLPDRPCALRNLVFQLPCLAVKIQVVPAIALRSQQEFAGFVIEAVERLSRINILI